MMRDSEVQQAVDAYRLGLPRMPVSGRTGELLGRGAGSSVEFQEYREYLFGDDTRHLDWAAFARSDTLMVRMYREEISPRAEILLDASRSMTTNGEKSRVARQLAGLFAQLCGRVGGRPSLLPLNDALPLHPLGLESLASLETLKFDGVASLDELLAEGRIPLKPQSVRIVISDFLFPHDPDVCLRRLAAGAGVLWVLQLLTAWEANPTEMGGRRLIDIEGGAATDLLMNRKLIDAYRERLGRLQDGLVRACRRSHARFVPLIADHGLLRLCREDLCAAEILRVG